MQWLAEKKDHRYSGSQIPRGGGSQICKPEVSGPIMLVRLPALSFYGPSKGSKVRHYFEMNSVQIYPELFVSVDDGEALFFCHYVAPIMHFESTTEVCHWVFFYVLPDLQ